MRALAREPAESLPRRRRHSPRRSASGGATRTPSPAGSRGRAAVVAADARRRRADRLRPAARDDAGRSRARGAAAVARHGPADDDGPAVVDLAARAARRDPPRRDRLPRRPAPRRTRRASPSPSIALVTVPNCEDVALTTLRSQTDELGLIADAEEEEASRRRRGGTRHPLRAGDRRGGRGGIGTPSSSSRPGPARWPCPRLRGQTEEQATRHACAASTSRVGSIDREPDPSVPDGLGHPQQPGRGRGRRRGLPGRPRHQHRADAVADAIADPGADADPHAGADPDADARRQRRRSRRRQTIGPLPAGMAGASMAGSPESTLGGTFAADGNRRPDLGRRIDL